MGLQVPLSPRQYNVNDSGSAGGGGEYEVQTGFGWTNGVVIDFLVPFGDELLDDDEQVERAGYLECTEVRTFAGRADRTPLRSRSSSRTPPRRPDGLGR